MATKKQIEFEASMERLEQIVRTLESGSEGLDSALKLYEEGIGLVRGCTEALDRAEMSMKALQMKPDGNAVLTDFVTGEEES